MKPSMFRKTVLLVNAAILTLTLLLMIAGALLSDRAFLASSARNLLESAHLAAALIKSNPSQVIDLHQFANAGSIRMTLIAADGAVLSDSAADPASMENHASRPEVAGALQGNPSWAVRISSTTEIRTLYAAVPLAFYESSEKSVLRLAMPLPSFFARLSGLAWIPPIFLILVAIFSYAASALIQQSITTPILKITEKAERYSDSESFSEIELKEIPQELLPIDSALDTMAKKILSRSLENRRMRSRYAAILESASEGIIASDETLRIQEINKAAAGLFGINETERTQCIGQPVLKGLRNSLINDIFLVCSREKRLIIREIPCFSEKGERHYAVHASPFEDEETHGIVAIVSDVTEIRRLERIRKDFVTNVSHEIRTPVQVIKGYAEIMSDILEHTEPSSADSNLFSQLREQSGIIHHSALRMEEIIKDLLLLSRLERDPGNWIIKETCRIRPILEVAKTALENQAKEKNMPILIACPDELEAEVNSGLLEQALTNLVGNALQYSLPGTAVEVSATKQDTTLIISVRDQGAGIPAKDLEHIFERFYRVDKSRNRSTGGTGLGLAIVKHIATAHGGTVSVESIVGQGTVFTISLPAGITQNL